MKSRILKVKDYREVDVEPLLRPFVPDETALEAELRRLTNPYIRWEPGEEVSAGDQVVCRLLSDCPRYNKEKVRFVAGSGMFQRELENLSIGMRVGETREAGLPEGKVSLTLAGVMNRVAPEPSDEMVEKLELDGVHTVAEYRAYLLEQQREAAFGQDSFEALKKLTREVISGSEFILYREDWAEAINRELDRCRTLCRQEGMVLEEMTPEQFQGRIPVKSYHELVAMLQYDGWDNLCRYLLGRRYAETDSFHSGEAEYEAFIADYAKTWRVSEESAREANPFENFIFNEYTGHAYTVLKNYIREFY